jgi:hypothetical protein
MKPRVVGRMEVNKAGNLCLVTFGNIYLKKPITIYREYIGSDFVKGGIDASG